MAAAGLALLTALAVGGTVAGAAPVRLEGMVIADGPFLTDVSYYMSSVPTRCTALSIPVGLRGKAEALDASGPTAADRIYSEVTGHWADLAEVAVLPEPERPPQSTLQHCGPKVFRVEAMERISPQ